MPLLPAYLLISHGSRDPRPQRAMEKLSKLVRIKLGTHDATGTPVFDGDRKTSIQTDCFWPLLDPDRTPGTAMVVSRAGYPLVGTATLELAHAPLHEQICQFASVAREAGCKQLQLLPLFLLPGVHVTEDIPREVTLAQQRLGQAVVVTQRPHLGAHPGLATMLASQQAAVNANAKILLSHGTRRAGGNHPVEVVADQLGAVAAYWSVQPTLEEQILALAGVGREQIAILPYFLFSGGITDAIAQSVSRLQEQFPKVQLSLCDPIGVSPELADLIVDLSRD